MSIEEIGINLVAIAVSVIGLFGWSHHALSKRLEAMESQLNKKMDASEVRTLFADKLAPYRVEYDSLSRRLDEIREDQQQLNHNMEQLLAMCAKLASKSYK